MTEFNGLGDLFEPTADPGADSGGILGQGASDVWNETPLDLPGAEPDPAADPDWGPPPANPDGDASSGDILKALEQAGGAIGEDGGMPDGGMSEEGGRAYEIQPDEFQPIDQM